MGQTATITKTGQITIPKWVREYLGAQPGQVITFKKDKGGIRIEREKTAEETLEAIRKLIPEEARRYHMEHYAGMRPSEVIEKWAQSEEGRAYFKDEMERCL